MRSLEEKAEKARKLKLVGATGAAGASGGLSNTVPEFDNEEVRREHMERLRETARQQYLIKRTEKQLELQGRLLQAEKEMLKYDVVSAEERKQIELREKAFDAALKHHQKGWIQNGSVKKLEKNFDFF